MHCPCCRTDAPAFLPFGIGIERPNARCPRCGSLERHRLLWLFLQRRPALQRPALRLLHVAPEPVLRRLFAAIPGVHYIPADLDARDGVRLDITRLPLPDASLDAVVCNHVLEHVPDDRQAMREFRRVLRPGGWAILQSPVDARRAQTYENPDVLTPEDRLHHFGQADHVRVYGDDYPVRLREAGFSVEVVDEVRALPSGAAAMLGLRREPVYMCQPS